MPHSSGIQHKNVLTAFIGLRVFNCLKDQCKVLTLTQHVSVSITHNFAPPPKKTRSQISFWALYKTWIFFLSFFPFIYFFYVKTKLRQRLALSLFHVFLLLLFYRSYSLLVPNPHWNLTLKRQQQYNGRSLLPVWPLQAPAAAAAMLCRGQTACQPRLPLSTSGLWPGPCTAESH